MQQNILEFLYSPLGILSLFIIGVLLLPLFKYTIWRLFAFDEKVKTMLAQKKSSEVRTGKVLESMAPLLKDFPVNVSKEGTSTVFVGQPIDYIHFDPDEGITFIEVKSGNARLNATQKKIVEHIEAGNIFWAEVRVKGDENK